MINSSGRKYFENQYIYIAGHGHSGSTLLEMVLGNHPHIFAMGELEKLSLQFARDNSSKYPGMCSCGKRPFDCSIWGKVMLNINEQFRIDIKKTPFKFRVSDVGFEEDYGVRSIFHWLIRNFYRLSRYICFSELPFPNFFRLILSRFGHNWSGHRFFVARSLIDIINAKSVIDSSKDCIGMRELYENRQGVMKIIFLTRDPRANAWSYVKAGLDPIDATKRWVAVNLRIRRFLDRIPHGDWISIRYEDFCADPEAICRKLSAFLNLEYSPEMLLFSKKIHTIGGNKIRYTRVSEIRQDLSWLHSLPAATTSEINKLFGKEISLMGYNV